MCSKSSLCIQVDLPIMSFESNPNSDATPNLDLDPNLNLQLLRAVAEFFPISSYGGSGQFTRVSQKKYSKKLYKERRKKMGLKKLL